MVEINRNEVFIPPRVLSEEEALTNMQKRNLARDFIHDCLWIVVCEPSDAEVLEHLNLWSRLDALEYD